MTRNINYLRDLMLTGFELSRRSKVPMLYLGNPGMGKTTVVNLWARRNGYHVESLIGSAFDRSEILGYMVNDGGEWLRTKDPEWFHSIVSRQEQGVPSVLFIDEIAGAPRDVQASLYRLIFERTIGNGHMLPDSTIIASASNYKENLPVMCDITSPNLNRFCIVNLEPTDFESLYTEFLQEPQDLEKDLPEFQNNELTPEMMQKTAQEVRRVFDGLNDAYCSEESSKGMFSVHNKRFSDVFDGDYSPDGEVLNFISGRTIAYYQAVFRAMYSIGLARREYVSKFVDGMIGLGCNTFTEAKELAAYRRFAVGLTLEGLSALNVGPKSNALLFAQNAGLAEKVTELSARLDSLEITHVQNAITEIYLQIMREFELGTEAFASVLQRRTADYDQASIFRNDYDAVELFMKIVDGTRNSKERDVMLASLQEVLVTYKFYVNTCIC